MISRRSIFKGFAAAAAATTLMAPASASAGNAPVTLEEIRFLFEREPLDIRKYLQEGLRDAGYYNSTIDGAWGPSTAAAFKGIMASPDYQAQYRTWNYPRKMLVDETMWFSMQGDGTDY
jgi:hypothetical protein